MAATKGIDCANPLTVEKAKAMAAAGMRFVCRYLVPVSMAWKRLTRAEAEAITAAGLKIVSVFQRGKNDAAGGAPNGTRDGKAAYQEAKAIGQPAGTAIYFAVDFDAQPKDYDAIEAYLRAAAKELPGYYVGVYGSYAVVEEMARRGAAKHFWQTYAWSRGKISKCANIYQYKNGQTLAGHTVDFNESYGCEGWWDTNPQKQEKAVNKPVDKQADTQTQEALKVLQAAGVIQTPEYWIQNAHEGGQVRGDYAALLIQNMAKKLTAAPTPQPQPEPQPELPKQPTPEPPATGGDQPTTPKPKPREEVERLAGEASVYFEVGAKNGSGVLIEGGYVLTAAHVAGREVMRVQTKDGRLYNIRLVAVHPDEKVDLAICQFEGDAPKGPYLPLSRQPVQSGQKLVAVGHGNGVKWAKKTGVLCRTETGDEPWEFDCSLPVQPDDSGSGVVNEFGEVCGIVVQRTSVIVQNGSVSELVRGGEAVNVAHPIVAEWLKQQLLRGVSEVHEEKTNSIAEQYPEHFS